MEVILLERIRKLGALGDKVNVKAGYGRNYLIPQGKAVYATAANMAKFEARRGELEKIAAEQLADATAKKQALEALGQITLTVKAGEEGKLFGSINTRDIADAIAKAGIEVNKNDINLPAGAIRHVGEYDVAIDLPSDQSALVKLNIASDAISD